MLRFLILLVVASPAAPYAEHQRRSAATPGQIKFATENQYDQTGPGAKGPETAYKTYKHLEEALIGYLNDKDTKLPERERAKAFFLLYTSSQKPNAGKFFSEVKSPYHENSIEPTFKPSVLSNDWRLQGVRGNVVLKDHSRWQKVLLTKSNPRSLSHYTREPDADVELADFIKPKYSAPHVYQQEASSPQVSTQSAFLTQGPRLDTHTFKGATHTHTHDGAHAHNFQRSAAAAAVSSDAPPPAPVPAYPGPTHAPHTHNYKGATHVSSESFPSSPVSGGGSAQSYQGAASASAGGSSPGQAGSAHSFYSFTDGEGHQHTIQYRTDHTQTAHFL